MSPRRYALQKRAERSTETRQRIVEATLDLHTRNGILGTSWKDIAARAGVAVGTVYNHFPTLDELLPACGALMMQRFRPPDPQDADAVAGPSHDIGTRFASVIGAVYGFYDRAGPAAEIDPRERQIPAITEWERYWAGALRTFVEVALGPRRPDSPTLEFIVAMLDQRTFAAMAARGITADAAVAEVTSMILAWLKDRARNPKDECDADDSERSPRVRPR